MASCVPGELIPCAFVWHDPGITPCCKTRLFFANVAACEFLIVRLFRAPFDGAAAWLAVPNATLMTGKPLPGVAGNGRAAWQAASGSARCE